MSSRKNLYDRRHLNRRQFLIGSGSAFLVLPPLLSLMPEKVAAQIMSTPKRRALMWLGINGVDAHQLYPAMQSDLIQQSGMYSVYSKPLGSFAGRISRMIDSDFVTMYPHMNLLQGLSLTGGNRMGHNFGVLAGVHAGEREPINGKSIDVIMEQSSGVYKTGEVVPHKALRLITGDYDRQFSFDRVNGKRITSDGIQGDKNLFNTLFANFAAPAAGAAAPSDDKLIVDRVYSDLKKLETSSRISSEDKVVLDRYISSVHELQLKINAASPTGPACAKPSIPFQATKQGNYWYLPSEGWGIQDVGAMYDNYIQLIKLAFACDLTRVIYVGCTLWTNQPIFDQSNGGTHHEAGSSEIAADRQQWGLKKCLKLAKELSATPDPYGGGSLLDNSVLLWSNEMGDWTTGHSILNMPVVTFGSCGGYFKTGHFVDYRQRPFRDFNGYHLGRPYKQLLQSIMLAMGVTKSEYSKYGDGRGFGDFYTDINQFGTMPGAFSAYSMEHNDPLPFVSKVA